MIKIRAALPSDFPTIQKIARVTWPIAYGTIISEVQIEYMLEMMYTQEALRKQVTQGNSHFILAEQDGHCLGFASYQIDYPTVSKTKVHKLYVLPETQGKGIGQLLMDAVAEIAKQHNNTALHLNVNKHNKALSFYKKYGFNMVSEEVIAIGNGFVMDDYNMEKELSIAKP